MRLPAGLEKAAMEATHAHFQSLFAHVPAAILTLVSKSRCWISTWSSQAWLSLLQLQGYRPKRVWIIAKF